MSGEQIKTKVVTTTSKGNKGLKVSIGGSWMHVIIDSVNGNLKVWYVFSNNKGDMKKMMDYLVELTGYNLVLFIYPISGNEKDVLEEELKKIPEIDEVARNNENDKELANVLNNYVEKIVEINGEKVPVFVTEWKLD